MRLLSFLIGSLLSISAFATSISSYQGAYYKTEELMQCEANFNAVSERLERKEGVKILDGGCLAIGEKSLQVKFSYIHPMLYRIDNFKRKFANNKECLSISQMAQTSFNGAGYQFINSFCTYGELLVHYHDDNLNMIRRLETPFSYNNLADCSNSLNTLKQNLTPYNMKDILWTCDTSTSFDGKEKYTIPNLHISGSYENHVRILMGKKLEVTDKCFENGDQVSRSFEASSTNILKLFCANKIYTNDLREVIAYIEKDSMASVKTFEGMIYTEKAECEDQLIRAGSNLESLGNSSLYQFCDPILKKSFRPVIYYIKKK